MTLEQIILLLDIKLGFRSFHHSGNYVDNLIYLQDRKYIEPSSSNYWQLTEQGQKIVNCFILLGKIL